MNNFSHDKPCVDHKGNIFGNIKSMCRFWHINPKTFSRRMNVYGMTLEEDPNDPKLIKTIWGTGYILEL